MKLFKTFRLEILEATVCLCVGMTYEEVIEYVEKTYEKKTPLKFIKKIEGYGIGQGYFAGYERIKEDGERSYHYIIYLGTWEFDDYHYTTLAHEATHIVQYLQKVNTIDKNEWEFLARLHTNVMKECLDIIREYEVEESDLSKEEPEEVTDALNVEFLVTEEAITEFVDNLSSQTQERRISFNTPSQHIWIRLKAHLREALENSGFIDKKTYILEDLNDGLILLSIIKEENETGDIPEYSISPTQLDTFHFIRQRLNNKDVVHFRFINCERTTAVKKLKDFVPIGYSLRVLHEEDKRDTLVRISRI